MSDSYKNRWYFNGVFYDTRAEFEEAMVKFAASEINSESVEKILKSMCTDMKANLFNPDGGRLITNDELKQICWECWSFFISAFRKKLKEKPDPPHES